MCRTGWIVPIGLLSGLMACGGDPGTGGAVAPVPHETRRLFVLASPGVPDLRAASDSGSSHDDDLTNETAPTFDVPCVNGATVTLLWDGPDVNDGSNTGICAGGTVAIVVDVAWGTDGVYTVAATQNDGSGESPASSALEVTLDTAAPAVPGEPDLIVGSDSGSSNSDDLTNDTTPTLEVECDVGATVTLAWTGAEEGGHTAACGASPVQVTVPAGKAWDTSGTYTATATQADAAGNNAGPSTGLTVTIDTAATGLGTPDLQAGTDSGESHRDDVTNDTRPIFDVACETGATVTLTWTGAESDSTTDTCNAGFVAITVPGGKAWDTQGVYAVTAIQTDVAGNSAEPVGSLEVTVDTAATGLGTPDLQAGSDSGALSTDDLTNDTAPVFDVACETGATVTLGWDGPGANDGSNTGRCAGGTVAIVVDWPWETDGAYTVTATQNDVAGNNAGPAGSLEVTLDTNVPAAPGQPDLQDGSDSVGPNGTNEDDITSNDRPRFDLTCEAGATVTLSWDDPDAVDGSHSGVCAGNGTVAIRIPNNQWTQDGVYSVTATQQDDAGGTSAASSALAVTFDTTANPPGLPDLQAGSDTHGANVGTDEDDLTSERTPDIDVSCEVGSEVTLYWDGPEAASGQLAGECTGGATVTFSIPAGMAWSAAGDWDVYAEQTDLADNDSAVSAHLTVTVDRTADDPGQPDLQDASDSLGANVGTTTDDITFDTTPTFDVGCEAGAEVTLTWDGPALDDGATTGVCGVGGSVAIPVPGGSPWSTEGVFTVSAAQEDEAGNDSGSSTALQVTLDVSVARPANLDLATGSDTAGAHAGSSHDDLTSVTTPTFDLTCEPGAHVVLAWDGPGGEDGALPEVCGGDGTASHTVPGGSAWGTDGAYALTATQQDVAGNDSVVSATLTVTLDTGAPNQPGRPDLTSASDGGRLDDDDLTNDRTPSFTVSCDPDAGVTLSWDGPDPGADPEGSVFGTCPAGGSKTLTPGAVLLDDGDYVFEAAQEDAAGNDSPASPTLPVRLDTHAPDAPGRPDLQAASDTHLSDDDVTSDSTPTLDATCEPGAWLTLSWSGAEAGSTSAACEDGGRIASTIPGLADGRYLLIAAQEDLAGNPSVPSAELAVVVDTALPDPPGAPTLQPASDTGEPGDGVTADSTPTFDVPCEPDALVTLSWTGQSADSTSGACGGGGSVALSPGALADGDYELTADQSDLAGNESRDSPASALTIDTSGREDLPRLLPSADPGTMDENDAAAPVRLAARIGNPVAGTRYTFSFDWRDGTDVDRGEVVAADQGEVSLTREHVYRDDRRVDGESRPYPATITVRTDEGLESAVAVDLLVHNLPPTASAVVLEAGSAVEGVPVAVRGTSTDPSPLDAVTHRWDFEAEGDCGGFSADAEGEESTHSFPDDGVHTVCVSAIDDDGGTAVAPLQVVVANAPPVFRDGDQPTAIDVVQGLLSCEPVVVADTGRLDHAASRCLPEQLPAGATLEAADVSPAGRVVDDLQPQEHVPCWLCWQAPGVLAPGSLHPARVGVDDGTDVVSHTWEITVVAGGGDGDEDGLPDAFEQAWGCLDAASADAGEDPDADGLSNRQEFERGSGPCDPNGPSAPVLVAPPDGASVRAQPVVVVVSNAADPDRGRVFPVHPDVAPLRYLFRAVRGPGPVPEPDPAPLGDACAGLVPEGEGGRTEWQVEVGGDDAEGWEEDTVYTWQARACDGWALGPAAGGSFLYNADNRPPPTPAAVEPGDLTEDVPALAELVWTCVADPDGERVDYGVEVHLADGWSVLDRRTGPCADGDVHARLPPAAGLPPDRWYEWTVRAQDASGAESEPGGPWRFLVNPDDRPPARPRLVRPVTHPVPPADARFPDVNVAEVRLADPTLVFSAPASPDPDGNVVRYVVEIDTSPDFDSSRSRSSPLLDVLPGEEGHWQVDGEPLLEDTFYWWRVVGHQATGPGSTAGSLFFVNVGDEPPSPGGEGLYAHLDSRFPLLRADGPPPSDPDRDVFACSFQVVRTQGEEGECSLGELAVEAEGVPPADEGVAWRVTTPLDPVGHYCWRHQCCDESSGCGAWSDWFPFRTNAPAACPRGIRLLSPDGDERIDWTSQPALSLTVDNADVPEAGPGATEVRFQVFSDPGLVPASLVFEVAAEEGSEGRTVLPVERGDERHEALVALLPGPGGERTFYWRAQAVAPAGCESEWTGIGRFVLHTPPPVGPCGSCAAAPASSAALVALLPLQLLARRRRRKACPLL